MEQSNIITKQDLEQAILEAVQNIKQFKNRELTKLILNLDKQDRPIIVPVSNLGYIVGTYGIKEYKSYWYVANLFNLDREDIFLNRSSAILYCLAEHNKNYKLANEIMLHNKDLIRLSDKVARYQRQAKNKKKSAYSEIRLSEYIQKLNHKQDLMTKTLKMAKYFYL